MPIFGDFKRSISRWIGGDKRDSQYPVEMIGVRNHRSSQNDLNGHVNIGFQLDDLSHNNKEEQRNGVDSNGVHVPVTIMNGNGHGQIDRSLEIPEEGKDEKRDKWDSPVEFLLSCVAMSVGLGNIWRFPFIAFENGGGAFLIPYLIVLTFIGRPIYFLELVIGQFSSKGQVKVWSIVPFFKGVGYASMIGTICLVSYYASLMGLTVFYFFASFQSKLPWSECSNNWVTPGCHIQTNLSCNANDSLHAYLIEAPNTKSNCSLSQLYYLNEVLQEKTQIDDGIGFPEWRLTLCLLFCWIFMWATLIKGVSSSGKVAYFTALFPYAVLLIMLIKGLTLPGALDGIWFFIKPDWKEMLNPKVWYAAVGQCFFSLSTGFGPIIMFSSFNKFRHNVYRDAWIISGLDTFTSLLAGFTIFAILGNLAQQLGVSVKDVAAKGSGLAFINYPTALASFEWAPQLFSVLFYSMLFTLGVGSATSLTGGLVTIFCDEFPKIKKWIITSCVCVSLFLIGLIYVTPGGQFMRDLVDEFGSNFVIYISATIEVIAIAWFYGLKNLLIDIEFMLGVKIGWYWKFCWGYFIPTSLTGILVYSLYNYQRLDSGGLPYPDLAIGCGWAVAATALAALPLTSFFAVKRSTAESWIEKLKESLKPSKEWKPLATKDYEDWIAFKAAKAEEAAHRPKIPLSERIGTTLQNFRRQIFCQKY